MRISRRNLLKIGAGAGVMASVGGMSRLMASEPALNMVTIPSSGRQVPSVGIGTVSFRSQADPEELERFRETLGAFHGAGGTLLDTSPNYGDSEAVLGRLMGELGIRGEMFLATKVDREDRAGGIRRMEASFQRLGRKIDRQPIDLMQVHNLIGTESQLATMKDWKARGRFRYIGITTHRDSQHRDIERVMRAHKLDFIQINYSIADREAADRLLPLARDQGVAVLVNRPFGKANLFSVVGDRPLPDWAADIDASSWGQVFLKYVISHPGALIPIPGTSKPHHALDNMGAARGRLPDQALRREMEDFMDRLV